ncbi:hypothetical protein [Mangrovicoccus algicola]|uniref:Uncharacterized protein n=1 Tax=Mangrovicoccus algicola TaxID=2771008 RepID=A0A8J6YWG9_9RHOB|nr:hypothetical protein [Mangrovicoccus algicola]MBE3637313.1 hypothetical protein [Mangrovicoccus algicola]
MDRLSSIFELREMLRQLERDVGLDRLSRTERDVLLAAHSLSVTPGAVVSSDQIRSHPLVASVTQATFYRAVRSLLGCGFLERATGSRAKSYTVRSDRIGDQLARL